MRPTPIDQESPFGIEELFFSRTDQHGVIEDGNTVFLRVGEYAKDELIGAPHNKIRHPDMPKSVFKLFWEMIQSGKPIGAYVKNMSATGKYYWVFAVAFPVPGGYLSVRLKPSTDILKTVKELYRATIAAEKTGGMSAGTQVIVESLGKLGFTSYTEFMTVALSAELTSRFKTMKAPEAVASVSNDEAIQFLINQVFVTERLGQRFKTVFDRFDVLSKSASVFSKSTDKVISECKALSVLAFNITSAARRVGESARTLTVVADTFQTMMTDVRNSLMQFEKTMKSANEGLLRSQFSISSVLMQLEISSFFLRENITAGKLIDGFQVNFDYLRGLVESYSTQAMKDLSEFQNVMRSLKREEGEIQYLLNGMDMIRQMGGVEASRGQEIFTELAPQIRSMEEFVIAVRPPMATVATAIQAIIQEQEAMVKIIHEAVGNLYVLKKRVSDVVEAPTAAA